MRVSDIDPQEYALHTKSSLLIGVALVDIGVSGSKKQLTGA
jgi:hypothetical protein